MVVLWRDFGYIFDIGKWTGAPVVRQGAPQARAYDVKPVVPIPCLVSFSVILRFYRKIVFVESVLDVIFSHLGGSTAAAHLQSVCACAVDPLFRFSVFF